MIVASLLSPGNPSCGSQVMSVSVLLIRVQVTLSIRTVTSESLQALVKPFP